MAATVMRRKGVSLCPNIYLFATSLQTKEYHVSNRCELHTSQTCHIDRRKDKAIATHLYYRNHEKSMKHRTLPIVDLPDYSYSDGRPTGISTCQKQRKEKNYQLAKQIVQYVGEMKLAEEQYISQTNEQARAEKARRESRLKEKNTQI